MHASDTLTREASSLIKFSSSPGPVFSPSVRNNVYRRLQKKFPPSAPPLLCSSSARLFSYYHSSGSCKPAQFFDWAECPFPRAGCPHFLFPRQTAVLKGESEFAGVAVRSAVGFSWADARRACVPSHVHACKHLCAPRLSCTDLSLNGCWIISLNAYCLYLSAAATSKSICNFIYLFIFFAGNVNLSWTERCPHKLIQPCNLSHLHF